MPRVRRRRKDDVELRNGPATPSPYTLRRLQRLDAKISKLRSKLSDSLDGQEKVSITLKDLCLRQSRASRRDEAIRKSAFHQQLVSARLSDLYEHIGGGDVPMDASREKLDRSRQERAGGQRVYVEPFTSTEASDTDKPAPKSGGRAALLAGEKYLQLGWYLRPSLLTLYWELAAQLREQRAQVFNEPPLNRPLGECDLKIDKLCAFLTPGAERGEPERLSRDKSAGDARDAPSEDVGVCTRSQTDFVQKLQRQNGIEQLHQLTGVRPLSSASTTALTSAVASLSKATTDATAPVPLPISTKNPAAAAAAVAAALEALEDERQYEAEEVTVENAWRADKVGQRQTRLYNREQMRRARRLGARCGLCPRVRVINDGRIGGSAVTTAVAGEDTELVGPFPKKDGSMTLFVHLECALWAPEVYVDRKTGQLRHVYEAYNRGKKLTCSHCGQRGATMGCYVESCKRTHHFRCLHDAKCRMIDEHFVSFCLKHRHRADSSIFRQVISAAAEAARMRSESSRRDVTHGLDTPHSYFTGLRRGDVEVIFSLIWGLSSVVEVDKVLESAFSRRRRESVRPTDRLCVRDGLCVLKETAFDIATLRFAAKGLTGGRSRAGVLLVRNFKGCKPFAPGAIRYAARQRTDEDGVGADGTALDEKTAILEVEKPAMRAWLSTRADVGSPQTVSEDGEPPRGSPQELSQAQDVSRASPVLSPIRAAPTAADGQADAPTSAKAASKSVHWDATRPDADKDDAKNVERRQVTGWLVFLNECFAESAKSPSELSTPEAFRAREFLREAAALWVRLEDGEREEYKQKAATLSAQGTQWGELAVSAPIEQRSQQRSRRRLHGDNGEKVSPQVKRAKGRPRKFYNIYREID